MKRRSDGHETIDIGIQVPRYFWRYVCMLMPHEAGYSLSAFAT
jgi:hypothetical protein